MEVSGLLSVAASTPPMKIEATPLGSATRATGTHWNNGIGDEVAEKPVGNTVAATLYHWAESTVEVVEVEVLKMILFVFEPAVGKHSNNAPCVTFCVNMIHIITLKPPVASQFGESAGLRTSAARPRLRKSPKDGPRKMATPPLVEPGTGSHSALLLFAVVPSWKAADDRSESTVAIPIRIGAGGV